MKVYASSVPPYYVFKSASVEMLSAPASGVFTWNADEKLATARIDGEFQSFPWTSDSQEIEGGISTHVREGDALRSLRWGATTNRTVGTLTLHHDRCEDPVGQPRTCTVTTRYAYTGSFTLPGALPTSGTIQYPLAVGSTIVSAELYEVNLAYTSLAIDFERKIVSANWTIFGREFILQGQYLPEDNTRLKGTVRTVDGQFSGGFVGNLFGKDAAEVGILFTLTGGENRVVAGRITGPHS